MSENQCISCYWCLLGQNVALAVECEALQQKRLSTEDKVLVLGQLVGALSPVNHKGLYVV